MNLNLTQNTDIDTKAGVAMAAGKCETKIVFYCLI